MNKVLTALTMCVSFSCIASAQTTMFSSTDLVGTWRCSTSFEDENSVTRVITETEIRTDGARIESGHIQWFDAHSSATTDFNSVSKIALNDMVVEVDLISLNSEQPKIRRQSLSGIDPSSALEKSVAAYKTYSSKAVLDVVELNSDRFATEARDDDVYSVCVKRG